MCFIKEVEDHCSKGGSEDDDEGDDDPICSRHLGLSPFPDVSICL